MNSNSTENTSVGHGISAPNSAWSFGGEVSQGFGQHVRQSVPLYDAGHELICQISDYFVKDGSLVYELGCSIGELSQKLAIYHDHRRNYKIHAIDCEDAMIQKACRDNHHPAITYEVQDICTINLAPSDLVIAYYTVQFVPPKVRQTLINTVYESLNWGGAFLLFEKVRAPDARFQDMMSTLYADFKLKNGFSPVQILNKTRSLKGVLEPFSTQGNLDMLTRAGFQDVMTVMKYLSFEGFLAIK